jgi:hypothetical protein
LNDFIPDSIRIVTDVSELATPSPAASYNSEREKGQGKREKGKGKREKGQGKREMGKGVRRTGVPAENREGA